MKLSTVLCAALASSAVVATPWTVPSVQAATLTFQDTTTAGLRFFDQQGNLIGTGSFEYSPEPIEGVFLFGNGPAVGGISGTLFVTDLSEIRIPEDLIPSRSRIGGIKKSPDS